MLIKELEATTNKQAQWDSRASVRCKPRRLLQKSDCQHYFFPLSRQPIAIHPLVGDLGEDACRYILIQTAYRYMHEIAILELDVVNSVALKIATEKSPILFAPQSRLDATAIITDEAYHAYVAFDFIDQVETLTNIAPLALPKQAAIAKALETYQKPLSLQDYDLLELVSVCLSEHVLTKDLVYLKNETNVCSFFLEVMQDHLLDEGRHASFFAEILTTTWQTVDEENRSLIAGYIPYFIDKYISKDDLIAHDKQILAALDFDEEAIEEIVYDTYMPQDKNNDINVKNFMEVLNKAGLLAHDRIREELTKNNFN